MRSKIWDRLLPFGRFSGFLIKHFQKISLQKPQKLPKFGAGHNFLNVLYLRAYKEGYEQFVLPHIDQFDTNMHTFTPDQITNSTDLCDIMIEKDADMTHFNNFWHMKNSFRSSGQTSEKYNILLHMHMDMGQNQMVTSRLFQSNGTPESLYIPNAMDRDNENGKASKIITWKYRKLGIVVLEEFFI